MIIIITSLLANDLPMAQIYLVTAFDIFFSPVIYLMLFQLDQTYFSSA